MGYSQKLDQKGDIWGTQKIWAKKEIFGYSKNLGQKEANLGKKIASQFFAFRAVNRFKLRCRVVEAHLGKNAYDLRYRMFRLTKFVM